MNVDVLIFGGGACGLWLLDECTRAGHRCVLVSNGPIGGVQTLGSQGILHSGIKYALDGRVTPTASRLSTMPGLWRDCLRGQRSPDLSLVRIRSRRCYLWQMERGGANPFTNVSKTARGDSELIELFGDDRPAVLKRQCSHIWRTDEWVIDPRSLVEVLAAQHRPRILHQSPDVNPQFRFDPTRCVTDVRLTAPDHIREMTLSCRHLLLTAGAGNAHLRNLLGLPENIMQRRPLRMVAVRGDLPELHGHSIRNCRPELAVTTVDSPADSPVGGTIWQLGGQLAEDAVHMTPAETIRQADQLLLRQFPNLPTDRLEWMTYSVDRAEGKTSNGSRPDGPCLMSEENVVTIWPTKLAFLPSVGEQVLAYLPSPAERSTPASLGLSDWPSPPLDTPPWSTVVWQSSDASEALQRPSAA